jgi:hypothetical protein
MSLPAPWVIAAEIVEDPQAALVEFVAVAESLAKPTGTGAFEGPATN